MQDRLERGNIVIPKGRLGSGWQSFGLNLRKILKPASLISQGSFHIIQSAPKTETAVVVDRPHNHGGAKYKGKATISIPKRDASISYALVAAGKWKNTSGRGVEGKNKSALVGVKILSDFSRNSYKKSILGQREQLDAKFLSDLSRNNRDTCKVSTLGQRELLGAKVLSTIKGIESDGINSELSLNLFMRMERGLDRRWAIVWSEVNEVGLKPIDYYKPKQKLVLSVGQVPNPKPFDFNKPKQQPIFKWQPKPSQPTIPLTLAQFQTHPHSKYSSQVPPSHLITLASTETSLVGSDKTEVKLTLTHMESTCTEMFLNNPDASVTDSLCFDAFMDVSLCSDGDVALQHDIQRIIHEYTDDVIKK
nr:hypothetical protein CFP56_12779 [Quercus suber]